LKKANKNRSHKNCKHYYQNERRLVMVRAEPKTIRTLDVDASARLWCQYRYATNRAFHSNRVTAGGPISTSKTISINHPLLVANKM